MTMKIRPASHRVPRRVRPPGHRRRAVGQGPTASQAGEGRRHSANASPDHGVLFNAESVPSDGSVDRRRPADRLSRRRRHHRRPPKGWDDAANHERAALGDKPAAPDGGQGRRRAEQSQGRGGDVLCRLLQEGRPVAGPPDHLPLQRRPRLLDRLAAHGRFRPAPGGDARRQPHPGRALPAGRQRLQPARRQRPRLHRRAGRPGFSRIAGKDKEKAFWGADADAYAFGEFVMGFLSKYGRWNSPKYLFGESYGTPRSAMLVNAADHRARHRLQRRDPALADPQLRPFGRRPGAQSGHGRSLCRRPADLRRLRLVPQPPARPAARRPRGLSPRGRAVRHRRLRLRPPGRLRNRRRPASRPWARSSPPTSACRSPMC